MLQLLDPQKDAPPNRTLRGFDITSRLGLVFPANAIGITWRAMRADESERASTTCEDAAYALRRLQMLSMEGSIHATSDRGEVMAKIPNIDAHSHWKGESSIPSDDRRQRSVIPTPFSPNECAICRKSSRALERVGRSRNREIALDILCARESCMLLWLLSLCIISDMSGPSGRLSSPAGTCASLINGDLC